MRIVRHLHIRTHVTFILIVFLVVDITNAGNCASGHCRTKRKPLQGIVDEERDLLEHLDSRSRPHETSLNVPGISAGDYPPISTHIPHNQESPTVSPVGAAPVLGDLNLTECGTDVVETESAELTDSNIPAFGVVSDIVADNFRIHFLGDSGKVKITDRSSGNCVLGQTVLIADCRRDHSVDRISRFADVLSVSGVSNSVLRTFGNTYVDYDTFLDCERSRRAIVWKVLPGFVSISEFRRNYPDRRIPIKKTFEIGKMVLDMVWKMLNVDVVHGHLSPATVYVGDGRTMIMDLSKASFKPFGTDTRDMGTVFQILVDMNPHIFRQFEMRGVGPRRSIFLRLLHELRNNLMGTGDLTSMYTSASSTLDLLMSMF